MPWSMSTLKIGTTQILAWAPESLVRPCDYYYYYYYYYYNQFNYD